MRSILFSGMHLNLQNISEDNRYISDDSFVLDGNLVTVSSGQPIHPIHGAGLRDFRERHPAMFSEMVELGFRFYQQPAGREDAIICTWKIREQAKLYGQTIAVRDRFSGNRAKTTRAEMFLNQQMPAWISSQATPMVQVAETHVIRPLKLKKVQVARDLRSERVQMAVLKGPEIVVKCDVYEIMRTLYRSVKSLKPGWSKTQYLRGAMYQNGWLSTRPDFNLQQLVKTEDQGWARELKLGSHRIRKEWTTHRYDHLVNGVPREGETMVSAAEVDH